ncbi:hypothetical protein PFISCL1PPCAC_28738, partial [Pristionchus fissidentatus]
QIIKALMTSIYFAYLIINGTFTFLANRELIRMKKSVKSDSSTSRSVLCQQRNMLIIVMACSISHFIKALHQSFVRIRKIRNWKYLL